VRGSFAQKRSKTQPSRQTTAHTLALGCTMQPDRYGYKPHEIGRGIRFIGFWE